MHYLAVPRFLKCWLTFLKRWLCLLSTLIVSASCVQTAAAATETWSLVINGTIYDVSSINNPSLGRLLSVDALSRVAKADGKVGIATRVDRGHIVLSGPVSNAKVSALQGFKTANVTLLVNQEPPITTRGQLVGGIPYIDVLVLQSALEKLGFNVLVAPDSSLISVFRLGADEEREAAGGGNSNAGGQPPRTGLLETVRKASAGSLQVMEEASGASTDYERLETTSGSGGGICQAMDTLRTLWNSTEPTAQEKATFQSLAQKFQAAKDNHEEIDPAELEKMLNTVTVFRAKARRRASGTKTWSTPDAGQRVQRYGNSFLDSVLQTLDLSVEMLEAMKKNDESFAERAEEDIETLKGLDKTVQEQGMRFNTEVIRVRQSNGCGPASLGLPPS